MSTTFMQRIFLFFTILILASLACDMSVTVNPPTSPAPPPAETVTVMPANTVTPATLAPTQIAASPTSLPATLAPVATATTVQSSFEGVEVTVDPLRIVLAPSLADGARGLQFTQTAGDIPDWEMTPGHIQLKLEGYLLQDRLHEPQIYVYPALAYAQMVPAAFEGMHRLNNIFYDPTTAHNKDGLPPVPFFNAQQVFASNIQLLSFQNGKGVRFLTEYAQFPAPANNHDLFYHFQGLSPEGDYYIVAILPVTAPMLAETSDAGAALPAGGVPYPYLADPNADMQAYYKSVVDVLNATPAEAFTPTLSQLDQLIQSMRINPQ